MQYFDFDLQSFVKNFQLDPYLVNNTLKILEQEGHCHLSENIFLPARVQFLVDKDSLYAFENSYAQFEPIIKTLLRTYQGIYDHSTAVFDKQIARILRIPIDQVKEQLEKLQQYGIIEYLPQKETPQIYFSLNRAPAEYLHIDQDQYHKRKKQYEKRLDAILAYVKTETGCRSAIITQYFGEPSAKYCGKCDNCLNRKKQPLKDADFKMIANKIQELVKHSISVNEILLHCQPNSQEEIWEALRFMEGEQLIEIDETGMVKKCFLTKD